MRSSSATALKIGSAIAIGVLLSAPWDRLTSTPSVESNPVRIEASTPAPERSAAELNARSTPEQHYAQVDGDYGFVQARDDRGAFVGYRVRGISADLRFAEGDVITHVNDVPVEDSAAGSELLLAALTDPGAEVALLR